MLHIKLNSYRSALDELATIPYLENKQQKHETLKLAIDCLCEIPVKERPKNCRLAIGFLILKDVSKAHQLIECELSKLS